MDWVDWGSFPDVASLVVSLVALILSCWALRNSGRSATAAENSVKEAKLSRVATESSAGAAQDSAASARGSLSLMKEARYDDRMPKMSIPISGEGYRYGYGADSGSTSEKMPDTVKLGVVGGRFRYFTVGVDIRLGNYGHSPFSLECTSAEASGPRVHQEWNFESNKDEKFLNRFTPPTPILGPGKEVLLTLIIAFTKDDLQPKRHNEKELEAMHSLHITAQALSGDDVYVRSKLELRWHVLSLSPVSSVEGKVRDYLTHKDARFDLVDTHRVLPKI